MSEPQNNASEITRTAVIEIEDHAAFEDVLSADGSVLVDFFADWCGPCHQMAIRIAAMAERFPERVATVDVDEFPTVAQEFNVRSLPTVIVFDGGQPIERFVGVRPTATLVDALD